MMADRRLSVAGDFSPYPFGRYRKDSDHSAEAFRDDILWPMIVAGDHVTVVLDGVLGGLGSSFLEEVFGGLVRKYGKDPQGLKAVLTIRCDEDPDLVDRAWYYVEHAYKRRQ